jgi:hypothetical protein
VWPLLINVISSITWRRCSLHVAIGEGNRGYLILCSRRPIVSCVCPFLQRKLPIRNPRRKAVHLEASKRVYKRRIQLRVHKEAPPACTQHQRCIPMRNSSSLANKNPISDSRTTSDDIIHYLYSNMSCTPTNKHTQTPSTKRIPARAQLYYWCQQRLSRTQRRTHPVADKFMCKNHAPSTPRTNPTRLAIISGTLNSPPAAHT